MLPEEKMAARLLARHCLQPPFNLEELAKNYAEIEYCVFPFTINADGVVIGIGEKDRPQILINRNAPTPRKKFTLAHELGHIFIPWHTGTIVSHVDIEENQIETDFEYRKMEAEANRFAAELILPTSWIIEKQGDIKSVGELLKTIITESGASRDATLIKVFNILERPIFCVQIESDGRYIKDYRSKNAPYATNLGKRNFDTEEIFTTAKTCEEFFLGDRRYKCWIFDQLKITENDERTWREILDQILMETNMQHCLQSINSTLAYQFQNNKSKPESEICTKIIQSFDGRQKFSEITKHHLFSQYVIKRVKELSKK